MKHLHKIWILLAILPAFMLVSCEDWFAQEPESEMVYEDFWQKKGDVYTSHGVVPFATT